MTREQAIKKACKDEMDTLKEGTAGHYALYEMADYDETEYGKAWLQVVASIRQRFQKIVKPA